MTVTAAGIEGPSPRVRGSQRRHPEDARGSGSIPACAGKPVPTSSCPSRSRVHPRVCGEALADAASMVPAAGPSPRVRGSLRRHLTVRHGRRSIPACAGKPPDSSPRDQQGRVHPRVCGEACGSGTRTQPPTGPSPRVRGSPVAPVPSTMVLGSIPACAGKPRSAAGACPREWVHPRVCGEAVCRRHGRVTATGPSPRVRGKQRHLSETTGPSPRVRGSLGDAPRVRRAQGSIPACAPTLLDAGPSPRVRGSLCQIIDGISVSIQLSMNGSGASA